MSWADKLKSQTKTTTKRDFEEELIEREKKPLPLLTHITKQAKKYCVENRQDWVIFITGNEGSGKSTLASHVCSLFDPKFSLDDSMIYSFRGENNSFLDFIGKYKDTPGKVAWYDEAVTVMFSQRHNSKDSADIQELFKIKRDCRHYDVLVSPSFWDIVPDIRERRIKSLLYCFTEVYHPTANRTRYRHMYAYYSGSKIIKLSGNKKAKLAFRSYKELFKIVPPDFIEEFPDMEKKFKEDYLSAKRANRDDVLERIEGITEKTGTEKLIDSFELSELKEQLMKLNPNAFSVEGA